MKTSKEWVDLLDWLEKEGVCTGDFNAVLQSSPTNSESQNVGRCFSWTFPHRPTKCTPKYSCLEELDPFFQAVAAWWPSRILANPLRS